MIIIVFVFFKTCYIYDYSFIWEGWFQQYQGFWAFREPPSTKWEKPTCCEESVGLYFLSFFFFWKNPTCNELWCFRLFEKNKINFVSSSAKNKCRKTKENKRNHHPKRRRRRKKAPPKINVKTCFEKQCSNVTSLSKFDTQKSNILFFRCSCSCLFMSLSFPLEFACFSLSLLLFFVFSFWLLICFPFRFSIFHCWWNKS